MAVDAAGAAAVAVAGAASAAAALPIRVAVARIRVVRVARLAGAVRAERPKNVEQRVEQRRALLDAKWLRVEKVRERLRAMCVVCLHGTTRLYTHTHRGCPSNQTHFSPSL